MDDGAPELETLEAELKSVRQRARHAAQERDAAGLSEPLREPTKQVMSHTNSYDESYESYES